MSVIDPWEHRTIWLYDTLYLGQRPLLIDMEEKLSPGWTRESILEHDNLGFMVPDGTDKAAELRKRTVRDWSDQIYTWIEDPKLESPFDGQPAGSFKYSGGRYRTIQNAPVFGFEVVTYSNRLSTSNKHIQIHDPRGFDLEISISNMVDVMLDGNIICGRIVSECIWGREKMNNLLMVVGSETWKHAKRKK